MKAEAGAGIPLFSAVACLVVLLFGISGWIRLEGQDLLRSFRAAVQAVDERAYGLPETVAEARRIAELANRELAEGEERLAELQTSRAAWEAAVVQHQVAPVLLTVSHLQGFSTEEVREHPLVEVLACNGAQALLAACVEAALPHAMAELSPPVLLVLAPSLGMLAGSAYLLAEHALAERALAERAWAGRTLGAPHKCAAEPWDPPPAGAAAAGAHALLVFAPLLGLVLAAAAAADIRCSGTSGSALSRTLPAAVLPSLWSVLAPLLRRGFGAGQVLEILCLHSGGNLLVALAQRTSLFLLPLLLEESLRLWAPGPCGGVPAAIIRAWFCQAIWKVCLFAEREYRPEGALAPRGQPAGALHGLGCALLLALLGLLVCEIRRVHVLVSLADRGGIYYVIGDAGDLRARVVNDSTCTARLGAPSAKVCVALRGDPARGEGLVAFALREDVVLAPGDSSDFSLAVTALRGWSPGILVDVARLTVGTGRLVVEYKPPLWPFGPITVTTRAVSQKDVTQMLAAGWVAAADLIGKLEENILRDIHPLRERIVPILERLQRWVDARQL